MDSHSLRNLGHAVLRALDWHRRLVAAVLAGIAVLASLSALRPSPPATRAVWAAARDLPGGRPLQAADLIRTRLPLDAVPAGALVAAQPVDGRLLAAPVRRGEPLTDVRLLEPALLTASGSPDDVAVPVRVADGAAATALVHPGDVVDVLAAGEVAQAAAATHVVAAALPVLAVPPSESGTGDGGLVVVAATHDQAAALASAAAGFRLSLALRPR